MKQDGHQISEEIIRLALAIDEYMPGYVDSYFGPQEWQTQAKQEGELPLQTLTDRTARLSNNISQTDNLDAQRKDFLARQVVAMQMSLRLLSGEKVSLAEEVNALYDIQPHWKDEADFEEAHKELDQLLPPGNSLIERLKAWNHSLEISIEKAKELLPFITKRLRQITYQKFGLPDGESFTLEWVSDKPWGAYNLYRGNYQSRIDINTDFPAQVNALAGLMAHEGYPGHHTELCLKEQKLVRQKNYYEHTIALLNSPACAIAEGLATTALKTTLTDDELADWYREEILPSAGMAHIDPKRMLEIEKAYQKTGGTIGNITFMLYDQNKSTDEVMPYLQRYGLLTEKEAKQYIRFVSDPLSRSYIFTYSIGRDLLEELFTYADRDKYFKRILEEPVTPSLIRQWISASSKPS